MAHQIEIINDVAQMAYTGEKPWHGLGQQLPKDCSVDDMVKAANLDWSVVMQPIFTIDAKTGEYVEVESRRVSVRQSDGKQLTVASPSWVPPQNKDFFEFCKEFSFEGGAQIETAGSLRGGTTVWALLNLGKDFWVGTPHDVFKNYLLLSWSHSAGRANTIKMVNERVVCANTEAIALREDGSQYRQDHSRKFNFTAAKEALKIAKAGIDDQHDTLEKIMCLRLNDRDIMDVLQPIVQPVTEDELSKMELTPDNFMQKLSSGIGRNSTIKGIYRSMDEAPGAMNVGEKNRTGYDLYNGVTHYIDHVVGRTRDVRLTSSWFGGRADIKTRVKKKLIEMAA